ncbi:MAG: hypothetical protein AB7P40_28570 [Chloroflexota bacterium]
MMVGRGTLEGQIVRVLDTDGTLLISAVAATLAADGAIILDDVDEPGTLIHYYFGRGERQVVMELPGLTAEGSLETWWLNGRRVWQVYIDRPLVTLGPVGSVTPAPVGSQR